MSFSETLWRVDFFFRRTRGKVHEKTFEGFLFETKNENIWVCIDPCNLNSQF